jgi:5'-nucleotidase
MRIFVTNDDGIDAEGLSTLREVLLKFGEVIVVAPDNERSAVGHSITLGTPIRFRRVKRDGELFGYAVSGTPADCVKLGLCEILKGPVDLLVSGINRGSNLGINAFYSGTVAAALEGALFKVPSMAISADSYEDVSFRDVGTIVERILPDILKSRTEVGWTFLNINIPNVKPDQVAGVRAAPMNCSGFEEKFQEHKDPRGGMVYWMMGGVLPLQETEEDDTLLIRKGFVTITPLRYDLTNREILEKMRKFRFSMNPGR